MFTDREIRDIAKIVKKNGIHSGDRIVFNTTDPEYTSLNGKESVIVEVVDGNKMEHSMNFDSEILPMYRIKLKDCDGENIDCYINEITKIEEKD